jgi:hypothetical protein
MYTEQRHRSPRGYEGRSRGPEVFYGYCHDTNRMRMMDYTDYVANIQTGYTNLYSNPGAAMRPIVDALSTMVAAPGVRSTGSRHHEHGCDCCGGHGHGCDCCGGHGEDCACSCCIRCADVVEYARCGETRRIPITFENDTRRERDVTLQLDNFATEAGHDVGWQATVTPTQFKLPPCGEVTAILTVRVDCGKLGTPLALTPATGAPSTVTPATGAQPAPPPAAAPATGEERVSATVDSCKVVYATLRAEGCMIRPMVIAVAVLPHHCGAHHAGCGCGCCC